MNIIPKFHPTYQNSCKTRKYNINNKNKYIRSMQLIDNGCFVGIVSKIVPPY